MGWELRGNHTYFYYKRPSMFGKKCKSVYIGNFFPEAKLIGLDVRNNTDKYFNFYIRSEQLRLIKQERQQYNYFFSEVDQYIKATWVILKDFLLASGYHCHQGKWIKANTRTLQKQSFLDAYLPAKANPMINRANITQVLNALSPNILEKIKSYPLTQDFKDNLLLELSNITTDENYQEKPKIFQLLINALCLGLLKYKLLSKLCSITQLDDGLGIYKAHFIAKRLKPIKRVIFRLYKYYNFIQTKVITS